MACSEAAAFLRHVELGMFSSQCHDSLVFAARQIANTLSPIAKKIVASFLGLTHNIFRKNI